MKKNKKPKILTLRMKACLALAGSDLLIKKYVDENLLPSEEYTFLDGKVVLRQRYNKGFLLDQFDDRPDLVRDVSAGAGLTLALYDVYLAAQKGKRLKKMGMTFITAGAISNLYDRLVEERVVDYIGIKSSSKKLSAVTANLGDVYIVLGSILTGIST